MESLRVVKKSKARKIRQKQKTHEARKKLKLALESSNRALEQNQRLVKVLENRLADSRAGRKSLVKFPKCKVAEDRLLSLRHDRRLCKTLATSSQQVSNPFECHLKFVRCIPFELIVITDEFLGSGRFGVCKKGFLQGTPVCVKYMNCSNETLEQNLISKEASVLSQLSHPSVCFVHGIQTKGEKRISLVMSLYDVDGFVVTIHDLISFDASNVAHDSKIMLLSSLRSSMNSQTWISILSRIVEGIAYIHGKSIIHRDLKTDNIVFYQQLGTLQPIIVDFGKSQPVTASRMYTLSEEQKTFYRIHHRHIAPDIVDGVNKPSYSSDMFSFGRIFKSIISYFPIPIDQLPRTVVKMVKCCLNYSPLERPSAENVAKQLLELQK